MIEVKNIYCGYDNKEIIKIKKEADTELSESVSASFRIYNKNELLFRI